MTRTGLEWRRGAPLEWPVLPIKYVADVTLGKMLQPEPSLEHDIAAPYVRAANVQESGLDLDDVHTMWFSARELLGLDLRTGDVLVVEGGASGRSVALESDLVDLAFQNSINRVRAKPGVALGRFINYVLKSMLDSGQIDLVTNKATITHLTAEKLESLRAAWPPIEEQFEIAEFLDRETAQIDAMIDAKHRLASMLNERRSAVVDNVVWTGLDEAVERTIVIDPAPRVPTHWRRLRNKNLFSESKDVSASGTEEMLTVSHITGVTPRSEKNVNMIEAESTEGYRLVQAGDLVINTLWAWMGALGVARQPGIVSPAYGVYRTLPNTEADPRYFHYLFRSTPYVCEMTRRSTGIWSSRLRIYPDVFLSMPVVLPPLHEQQAMADSLDTALRQSNALIAAAEHSMTLMRERRAALITAAVAGRLDPRTGVERLGEVMEGAAS